MNSTALAPQPTTQLLELRDLLEQARPATPMRFTPEAGTLQILAGPTGLIWVQAGSMGYSFSTISEGARTEAHCTLSRVPVGTVLAALLTLIA